jgi:hypothetical protein
MSRTFTAASASQFNTRRPTRDIIRGGGGGDNEPSWMSRVKIVKRGDDIVINRDDDDDDDNGLGMMEKGLGGGGRGMITRPEKIHDPEKVQRDGHGGVLSSSSGSGSGSQEDERTLAPHGSGSGETSTTTTTTGEEEVVSSVQEGVVVEGERKGRTELELRVTREENREKENEEHPIKTLFGEDDRHEEEQVVELEKRKSEVVRKEEENQSKKEEEEQRREARYCSRDETTVWKEGHHVGSPPFPSYMSAARNAE